MNATNSSPNGSNHANRSEEMSGQPEHHDAFYQKMQRRLNRIRKGIEELSSRRALVKSSRKGTGQARPDYLQGRSFHFAETTRGEFRLSLN